MNINDIKPGEELYNKVRAGFIAHGSSLNKWCSDHGVHRQNATAVLKGMYDGPKGKALKNRLLVASGVAPASENTEVQSNPASAA